MGGQAEAGVDWDGPGSLRWWMWLHTLGPSADPRGTVPPSDGEGTCVLVGRERGRGSRPRGSGEMPHTEAQSMDSGPRRLVLKIPAK